ncbi:DUF6384 family protein [Pseudoduganella sp. UC29_71]|jgi:hypothetical protein|uniref:DUF6384 family protein n=1 Tax=Pseudoduganella sp. UC29_71 TaxID=3350174 RepID=UPI00366B3974
MAGALSEQLGAMAIIDELRHRQMVVEEHLDLPRRREEVAARIREYYTANGLAVGDELIAEGVRAYFAQRLEFEPGPGDAAEREKALQYIAARRAGQGRVPGWRRWLSGLVK